LRDLGKDGAVRSRRFGGKDILNPPGRMKRFHCGIVSGHAANVKNAR
jgi:hypothetical protein